MVQFAFSLVRCLSYSSKKTVTLKVDIIMPTEKNYGSNFPYSDNLHYIWKAGWEEGKMFNYITSGQGAMVTQASL